MAFAMLDKKGRCKKQDIAIQHMYKMMWGQSGKSDFKLSSEIVDDGCLSLFCFAKRPEEVIVGIKDIREKPL